MKVKVISKDGRVFLGNYVYENILADAVEDIPFGGQTPKGNMYIEKIAKVVKGDFPLDKRYVADYPADPAKHPEVVPSL